MGIQDAYNDPEKFLLPPWKSIYNDESYTKENVLGECEENFLHVQIPGSYRKFWDNTITV